MRIHIVQFMSSLEFVKTCLFLQRQGCGSRSHLWNLGQWNPGKKSTHLRLILICYFLFELLSQTQQMEAANLHICRVSTVSSFKFENANVHGIWCDVVAAQWFATHDEAAKKKERPKGSTWVAHFLNFHSDARSRNRCTAILLRGLYQWPHRYKWLAMFCSLQHPGVRACWSEDWFGLMPLCHFVRWILTYCHCRNSILVREAIRESDRIFMSQKKFFNAQLRQWKQHAAGTQWASSMPHAPWRVRRYSWKRSRLGIMETDGDWWRLSRHCHVHVLKVSIIII